jgi:hypothetical protein
MVRTEAICAIELAKNHSLLPEKQAISAAEPVGTTSAVITCGAADGLSKMVGEA